MRAFLLSVLPLSAAVSVNFTGVLYYKLVQDLDNRHNTAEIRHTYKYEYVEQYSSQTFTESVNQHMGQETIRNQFGLELGVSYGPVSAGISVGHENLKQTSDFMSSIFSSARQESRSKREVRKSDYPVGGGSLLKVYQLQFSAPMVGIHQEMDLVVVRTGNETVPADEEIPFEIEFEKQTFISGMEVVISDRHSDKPPNAVHALHNLPAEIDYGYDSKVNLWIVPQMTNNPADACEFFELSIQDKKDNRFPNLAEGSKGQNRYLRCIKGSSGEKVREVVLYRGRVPLAKPDDWQEMTTDINSGRENGSQHVFLHLLARTVKPIVRIE